MNTTPVEITEDLISYSNFTAYEKALLAGRDYLMKYVFSVIVILGLIGNSLTIAVMAGKTKTPPSTRLYLSTLAVSDSINLILSIPCVWISRVFLGVNPRVWSEVFCKVLNYLVYLFAHFSSWILVSITLERFVAVAAPLKTALHFTKRRAAVGLLVTFLLLAAINSMVGMYATILPLGMETECVWIDEAAATVIDAVDLAFYSVGPSVALIALNAGILYKMKLSGSFNENASSNQNKYQRSLTITLLLVTFVFLICALPITFLLLYTKNLPIHGPDVFDVLSMFLRDLFLTLLYVNYGVNFFLYCLAGQRFRNELKLLLCPRREDTPASTSSNL